MTDLLTGDDAEDIRRLLALTLSRDPGVTVVGAAGDGEAAIVFRLLFDNP
jgi:hypothetical protein